MKQELIDYVNDTCDRIYNLNNPYIEVVRKKILSGINHCQKNSELGNMRKYFDRIPFDRKYIMSNHFKNFELIKDDVGVAELYDEVHSQPNNWYYDTRRQEQIHLHKDTMSIPLTYRDVTPGVDFNDSHIVSRSPMYYYYPKILNFVNRFCYNQNMKPGIISIVKLFGGKEVLKHSDVGEYYLHRNRYHLNIYGTYDFYVSDDMVTIEEGNFYRIDNKMPHRAVNNMPHERIAIIFDAG